MWVLFICVFEQYLFCYILAASKDSCEEISLQSELEIQSNVSQNGE